MIERSDDPFLDSRAAPEIDEAPRGGPSEEAGALGSDPFAEVVDEDPFLRGLSALGGKLGDERGGPGLDSGPVAAIAEEPTPFARPRAWTSAPPLAEVEVPDPTSWIDRLIDVEDRRRLGALAHLVEGDGAYDRFGLSPEVLRRTFPLFYGLYKLYFRVFSEGHENIPRTGPAILACNHAGLLPFDGSMIVVDAVLNTDPPRLPRAIVDLWAGSLPFVNIFFARVGQVVGTRENFADLLDDGQLLLVFPEGMKGVRKPITQRYRLQSFHVGFIEQSLLAGAPVVPMAVIGSDDQTPILYDLEPIARRLGLPSLPITPTFPWLGPLGLLPYPVGYHIVYGEPFDFHERFGPEDAKDPKLVAYLAKRVRRAVQQLVDRNR